jgi:hypothetical protein
MKLRNIAIAVAGLAIAAAGASAASAHETVWQHRHPLRVQVNHRIVALNHSIAYKERHGEISVQQAHTLRMHVHSIRMQEQRVASRRGSHIGYAEQARLNREENAVRHHL